MLTERKAKKVIRDPLELVIPSLIINRSHFLKTSNVGDVSRLYNITLKSPENKNLFVDSEENLRDLLQEYLNYKKYQKEVEANLSEQKANSSKETDGSEIKNQGKKKKVKKRTTKITRIEYYNRTPEGSVSSISNTSQIPPRDYGQPGCSHECKGMAQTQKRSCCVIL